MSLLSDEDELIEVGIKQVPLTDEVLIPLGFKGVYLGRSFNPLDYPCDFRSNVNYELTMSVTTGKLSWKKTKSISLHPYKDRYLAWCPTGVELVDNIKKLNKICVEYLGKEII